MMLCASLGFELQAFGMMTRDKTVNGHGRKVMYKHIVYTRVSVSHAHTPVTC